MKLFEEPEYELIRFDAADVIATSPYGQEDDNDGDDSGDLMDISPASYSLPGSPTFGQNGQ